MSVRVDRDDAASTIQRIRADLDEFKASQTVGGDSSRLYLTQAMGTYTVAYSSTASKTITFTSDGSRFSLSDLTLQVAFTTPSNFIVPFNSSEWPEVRIRRLETSDSTPKIAQWIVSFFNNSTSHSSRVYYFHFTVQATSPGALSV